MLFELHNNDGDDDNIIIVFDIIIIAFLRVLRVGGYYCIHCVTVHTGDVIFLYLLTIPIIICIHIIMYSRRQRGAIIYNLSLHPNVR